MAEIKITGAKKLWPNYNFQITPAKIQWPNYNFNLILENNVQNRLQDIHYFTEQLLAPTEGEKVD